VRVTFIQRAGEHVIYAPTAFDSQIGKEVPLKTGVAGPVVAIVTIVAAEVAKDGRSVLLTYEGPDAVLNALRP
jgi:hypothetical protein